MRIQQENVHVDRMSQTQCLRLTGQEEGVVLVSGRMLLRLEQGVEVPEGAFYEVVGRHLAEAAETQSSFVFSGLSVCVCVFRFKCVCFQV